MPPNPLREKVVRLLTDLGDDAETVATVLRAQGCVGTPFESMACPVAVYLQRAGVDHRGVGAHYVLVGRQIVTVPRPVEAFIDRFDDGAYPDLEAK